MRFGPHRRFLNGLFLIYHNLKQLDCSLALTFPGTSSSRLECGNVSKETKYSITIFKNLWMQGKAPEARRLRCFNGRGGRGRCFIGHASVRKLKLRERRAPDAQPFSMQA